ncbi:hypothetical protein D9619_013665 [Psilocybe cf. subviscida]|uniref:Uncharacterized protein n=1 Tax=Psilocybe cf. subviscida TaxID=2480587 RepID=A0A8H5BRW3_9AGAR|nr:hypothetical protein D9619_013665 [Psilocybe cf. subviscida]
MLSFRTRREYRAVPSDSDLDQSEVYEKPPPPTMSGLAKIATFLAVTCTIFNLSYLAYMAIPYLLHREPDLASLPRPNQFIGLERINYTKYPFPNDKIATFAGVIETLCIATER